MADGGANNNKKKPSREAAGLSDHLSWREQSATAAGSRRSPTNSCEDSTSSRGGAVDISGEVKVKADPDDAATTTATAAATSATASTKANRGLIYREEILGRRVQVLFDVDSGPGDADLAQQWYEGTVTAVQLALTRTPAVGRRGKNNNKSGGSGGRGRKRSSAALATSGGGGGADEKSSSDGRNLNPKLEALHLVKFDDGDERWFDVQNWLERKELKWVGTDEENFPDPKPAEQVVEVQPNVESSVAEAEQSKSSSASTKKKDDMTECSGQKSTFDPSRTAAAPSTAETAEAWMSEKEKSLLSPPPAKKIKSLPQVSPPHQLMFGKKYYMV